MKSSFSKLGPGAVKMANSNESKPVLLDDVNSLVTRIYSAEIAMSANVMSDLLNKYVFAYPGAPLKQIVVAKLDVTADGEIRFHADKFSSAHVPFKGRLHLFGDEEMGRI